MIMVLFLKSLDMSLDRIIACYFLKAKVELDIPTLFIVKKQKIAGTPIRQSSCLLCHQISIKLP